MFFSDGPEDVLRSGRRPPPHEDHQAPQSCGGRLRPGYVPADRRGLSHRSRQRPTGDPPMYSGQGGRRQHLPHAPRPLRGKAAPEAGPEVDPEAEKAAEAGIEVDVVATAADAADQVADPRLLIRGFTTTLGR